jgi:hypothetical protein
MAEEDQGANQVSTSASLLEDASTLLMFHSAAVNNQKSPTEATQQLPAQEEDITSHQHQQQYLAPATAEPAGKLLPNAPIKNSPSPTMIHKPHLPTPRMNHLTSPGPAIAALSEPGSDDANSKSQKAMVAAAALAAAADFPIPSSRSNLSVEESLRPKSPTSGQSDEQQSSPDIRRDSNQQKNEETDVEDNTQDDEPRIEAMDVDENATTADEKEFNETEPELEKDQQPVPRPKRQKKQSPSQQREIPKDYIVGPDSGIITCICGSTEDDGFTIQCDHCNRWQHAVCMGIDDADDIPDKFECHICRPRNLDTKKSKVVRGDRPGEQKGKRGSRSSASDPTNDKPAGSDNKEERQKPKPKPVTAYNKNLEESDILVPEPKNAWKAIYYSLKTYDYQDGQVLRYVESLKGRDDPHFEELTTENFEVYQFPKVKVKSYTDVNSKKFNGITKVGLFTETTVDPGRFMCEYLGEIGFRDKYIADSRNHYRIWGVEKPYVSFIPRTPLVIDARISGNLARYIRRSCHPNCELRVLRTDDDIKFVIVATKNVKSGTELTLPWSWDPLHPILNIMEGNTFDSTADADKPSLVLSVESILTFVDCGCPTTGSDCCLSKVKKASAHIYRSTRKGNSTSGMKLMQREAQYVSIQERLLDKELSDIRNSVEQAKSAPLISNSSAIITEAQVTIRPYLYNYLKKRPRSIPFADLKDGDYLPVPITLMPEEAKTEQKDNGPLKPVKKLSFADYKKKMKPTS